MIFGRSCRFVYKYLPSRFPMHTVSFLFKFSGLKKLVKWSGYEKVNFITNFHENSIFYKSFLTTWRQNAPLALMSDQNWHLKSSNLENLRRRLQQMLIIMFLKIHFFQKNKALESKVAVNLSYQFWFQKFRLLFFFQIHP